MDLLGHPVHTRPKLCPIGDSVSVMAIAADFTAGGGDGGIRSISGLTDTEMNRSHLSLTDDSLSGATYSHPTGGGKTSAMTDKELNPKLSPTNDLSWKFWMLACRPEVRKDRHEMSGPTCR